jgi:hypothetical protein
MESAVAAPAVLHPSKSTAQTPKTTGNLNIFVSFILILKNNPPTSGTDAFDWSGAKSS